MTDLSFSGIRAKENSMDAPERRQKLNLSSSPSVVPARAAAAAAKGFPVEAEETELLRWSGHAQLTSGRAMRTRSLGIRSKNERIHQTHRSARRRRKRRPSDHPSRYSSARQPVSLGGGWTSGRRTPCKGNGRFASRASSPSCCYNKPEDPREEHQERVFRPAQGAPPGHQRSPKSLGSIPGSHRDKLPPARDYWIHSQWWDMACSAQGRENSTC